MNCQLIKDCAEFAIQNNHLHCVKYIYGNHKFPWCVEPCRIAAKFGNIKILQYLYNLYARFYIDDLYDSPIDWNEYICYEAAEYGNLECLKYAYENNCPCNEYTCLCAYENEQFESYCGCRGCYVIQRLLCLRR